MADLVALQYKRNDQAFERGTLPPRGDTIEIFPAHHEDRAWRVSPVRRRDRGDHRVRPADRQEDRRPGRASRVYANSHYVTPRPTLNQAINRHQGRAEGAPRLDGRQRQAAGGPAAGAAHHLRPRDDGGHRLLRRHRELQPLPHRPPRRASRRRPSSNTSPTTPCCSSTRATVTVPPDRRHVPRRLPPQVHPGRIRLPPALLHRQPPAEVRGVGRHAARTPSSSRPPPARGRWSAPAASSPSR